MVDTKNWDLFASLALPTASGTGVVPATGAVARLATAALHASLRTLLVAVSVAGDTKRLGHAASLATWTASMIVVLCASGAIKKLARFA
mmetsp:Transcript_27080/g.49254  ORF Transcript_27080/g.49254 Transcript_27080/m.49254 type:complete len:89 (-) Transcript_27080:764-1030(-)